MNTTSQWAYVTGGTIAPGAPSYVERVADRDLLTHLESGETCYVLNSRQMGKSSLCVRTIGKLKEQGVRTVFCDLTKFGGRNLTAEQWYAALLSEVGRDLGLRNEFLAYWKDNSDLPAVQRLFGALVEEGLKQDSPVVVFIDEIDVTLSLPFSADEFFAAIRQCYVGRATDERLKRLNFCLLGTATPADLIQDTRVSPFNIGKRIELRDFTAEEAAPLAAGLAPLAPSGGRGAGGEGQRLLARVLHWTGGHPYLTQRLCQAVCDSASKNVDQVCSDLFLTHSAKESDDNLAFVRNRLLKSEADLAALLDLYKKMRSGKSVQDDETNPLCAILKLSGVARVKGGLLKVRNRIYEHVFDRDWVETHLPDAEKRRQREAYRKGLFRAASVGVGVVGAIAVLAIQAMRAERASESAKLKLDYQLYVAKINNLQISYDEGDVGQMSRILEETEDSPHKGWEWGYWQSLLQDSKEQYALEGVADPLQHALFSHDAKEIMIVDRKVNRAILVNRETKQVVGTYALGEYEYLQQDGPEWVAWSDQRDSLRVRDLVSGKVRFEIPLEAGSQGFIFGPRTSQRFLVVHQMSNSDWRTTTSIVDSRSGETIWPKGDNRELRSSEMFSSISADGRRIVMEKSASLGDLTRTYVVRDRAGNTLDELRVSANVDFSATISPGGRYWICGERDRLVLRDVATRKTLQTIDSGAHGRYRQAQFNSAESMIVLTTDKNRAVILSVQARKELGVYLGAFLSDVSPSSDEVLLSGERFRVVSLSSRSRSGEVAGYVSAGTDGKIVIQGLDSLQFVSDPDLRELRRIGMKGGGLAASANGRIYATFEPSSSGRESILRETESGRVLARSRIGWYGVDAPNSADLFVTLTADSRVVEVRRLSDTKLLWKKTAEPGNRIYQASISADGSLVVTANTSGRMSVTIHDALTGARVDSGDGTYWTAGFVASGSDYWISQGNALKVFDGATRKLSYEIPAGFNVIRVLRSSDGKRVVTVGGNSTGTTIWDVASRQRLCRIAGFDAGCFTSDGKTLVGIRDGRLATITVGSSAPVTRISATRPSRQT